MKKVRKKEREKERKKESKKERRKKEERKNERNGKKKFEQRKTCVKNVEQKRKEIEIKNSGSLTLVSH